MNLSGTCIIHSEYGTYKESSGSSKFNDFDENSRKKHGKHCIHVIMNEPACTIIFQKWNIWKDSKYLIVLVLVKSPFKSWNVKESLQSGSRITCMN